MKDLEGLATIKLQRDETAVVLVESVVGQQWGRRRASHRRRGKHPGRGGGRLQAGARDSAQVQSRSGLTLPEPLPPVALEGDSKTLAADTAMHHGHNCITGNPIIFKPLAFDNYYKSIFNDLFIYFYSYVEFFVNFLRKLLFF